MRPKVAFVSLIFLMGLVGCNQQGNEGAQPQIGENSGQVIDVNDRSNMKQSQDKTYEQPYNHNYQGTYSGAQETNYTDEIRSAQQVASRANETARTIQGVDKAISVAQGMDIVVAVETKNTGERKGIERRVREAISKQEQGYNVYVSTDAEINEQIERLFSSLNNVKTSFVTKGIGDIIYQIGQKNGR